MTTQRIVWLIAFLLIKAAPASTQTLLLEPSTSRFLINEKSGQPRLDLIIQTITAKEKQEIAKHAVMDTLTKPTFIFSKPGIYHVTAGRMAERLTPVIRNGEKLPAGYQVRMNGQLPGLDRRSAVTAYMLNEESCMAAASIPFGPDSVTISLLDAKGELLSELRMALLYPKPELFYVNINTSLNANLADTTELRKFMHFFNRAPNIYSRPNAVPDSLSIAENEIFFGFKKAYYDGEICPTRIRYRVGSNNAKWIGTFKELTPFVALKQSNENWTWLVDGNYELQFSYSADHRNYGTYPFAVDHHWLNSLAYNSQLLIFIPMALLARPWLAALVISVIIYLWFRGKLKKTRQLAAKTNLELQAIQSQLNPHFVFNALSSLQGLINQNQIDRANTYLSGFSKLMRNTLYHSHKEMVPLSVEISNIENYIKLEQLRFGFNYQIDIEPQLANLQTELPPLLIQPVVENAIKHGISDSGSNGQLVVSYIQNGAELIVKIKDNGKGFDTAKTTSGKGLTLTRERIKLLNTQQHLISMHIVSNGNGTQVTLTFKHWL